ncbi:MAG: phosphoglycerate dehydrogenase [Oscillospiraceae bacterium]|nr:phosphoglycerate dehydrogenase [Oscillospiraceae bacterium]
MYKILTLNKIAKIGLDKLDPKLFSCSDSAENPDGVLVRSADMKDFPLDAPLQAIARAGAGVNNIPVARCSEAGVVVFNTPGANAGAVKELALCALFLASRDITGGIDWARGLSGKGAEVPGLVEKGKSQFAGREVAGKTLGVVGLGAIGVMVANAALALGMDVLGFDPYLSVDAAWGLSRDVRRAAGLKQIYAESDYLTLHLPLGDETRGMIGQAALAQCRPGLRLINLARGELVNTADLLAALDAGRVAAYVTDFPADAMLAHPRVLPIPHLGASTAESEDNCAVMAARELSDYLRFGRINNAVNFPNIELEFGSGGARLCLAHRNVPNMVGFISSVLADAGVNIENMVNKSKKEYAYTLMDINALPDEALLDGLRAREGILRVRAIPRPE